MEFMTKWRRPPKVYEKVDDRTITEQAGSVPISEQVKRFTAAGLRLESFNRLRYDAVDEKVEIPAEYKPEKDAVDEMEALDRARETATRISAEVSKKQAAAVEKAQQEAARAKVEERAAIEQELMDKLKADGLLK